MLAMNTRTRHSLALAIRSVCHPFWLSSVVFAASCLMRWRNAANESEQCRESDVEKVSWLSRAAVCESLL